MLDATGLQVRFLRSDLFNNVDERDFDLVVFNTPLIDKTPEDDLEWRASATPAAESCAAI